MKRERRKRRDHGFLPDGSRCGTAVVEVAPYLPARDLPIAYTNVRMSTWLLTKGCAWHGSSVGHRCAVSRRLEPRVGSRQSVVVAQHVTLVSRSEQAAPLKQRHHFGDEHIEHQRQ